MAPPAISPLNHEIRDISDYARLDELEFKKTWLLPETEIEAPPSPECTSRYFETDLKLDKVFKSSSEATATAHTPMKQLPKYNLTPILQAAFKRSDALKDNIFLNPEAGAKVCKSRHRQKRVTFAKTEISEQHLPNCRRKFVKQVFGHLHAPHCRNHFAEKMLNKQDFLIRGNFIRTYSKVSLAPQDFYHVPTQPTVALREDDGDYAYGPGEMNSQPLPVNQKQTTLDSISYHEQRIPSVRNSATSNESGTTNFVKKTEFTEFAEFETMETPFNPPLSEREQFFTAQTTRRSSDSDDSTDSYSPPSSVDGGKQIDSGFCDSGFCCDSDEESDECDIEELIQSNKKKQPASTPHQPWFKSTPVEKNTPPPPSPPVTQPEEIQEEKVINQGYKSPFSKDPVSSDHVIAMKSPSVIAKLVCETNSSVMSAERQPPVVACFQFDTPSPDDIVRSRQAALG